MMSEPAQHTLAEINLSGCPPGNVFEHGDPDTGIEERFFKGWHNPLANPVRKRSTGLRVVGDAGRMVLDHYNTLDCALVAGDDLRADYAVEASVRPLHPHGGGADYGRCGVARTGVMARYRDLRHYYMLCLEGLDRVVLYRRDDETWIVLDEEPYTAERDRYHLLRLQCEGSLLRCFVDGRGVFAVSDDVYATGRCGVRTNARARLSDIRVTTTAAGQAAFGQLRDHAQRELDELRERYPRAVLARRIDISRFGPAQVRFGNLRGEDELILLCQPGEQQGERDRITALDFSGEVAWEADYPRGAADRCAACADMDRDGATEIVFLADDRIVMVDALSGEQKAEAPVPASGPFFGHRNQPAIPHKLGCLWPCNLRGADGPLDIIFRDGDAGGSGFNIWAYDERLNLRWTRSADEAWYGMYMWFCDVDGDGRDEILPGYHLYDGDGELLWLMEGAEYFDRISEHADHAAMGPIAGDGGMRIGIAASDHGFFLVDALTGEVLRRHRVGHAQGIHAGSFRKDLPGLEMWVGNRWGNYGILNLFSAEGDKLVTIEPDNISQGGPPVNWLGDGEELMLLATTRQALGMYDGYGRKVVVFPEEELPGTQPHLGGAMVRPVLGDRRDEIIFRHEGSLRIFTQDRPFAGGERIYAPTRRTDISLPGWQPA